MSDAPKNTKNVSHTKDLVLLFAIPLAIMALAVAAVHVPRLAANPQHDFLYTVCENYQCNSVYDVGSNGYISQDVFRKLNLSETETLDQFPSIRYYDVSENSFRRLTPEEARTFRLNDSSKSPDGYELERDTSGSGFLFWGDYDETWYLADGPKKKAVKLSLDEDRFSNDITFLGWVE